MKIKTDIELENWPLLPTTPAEEAVRRGMEVLDTKQPGWEERIDLDTLEVESIDDCILCQVLGIGFTQGARKLLGVKAMSMVSDSTYQYGFNCGDDYTYEELDAVWTAAIKARRSL